MDLGKIDRGAWFEVGALAMVASIVVGFGVLIAGRLAGKTTRQGGKDQPAPAAGEVPNERQQHVSASSPR